MEYKEYKREKAKRKWKDPNPDEEFIHPWEGTYPPLEQIRNIINLDYHGRPSY